MSQRINGWAGLPLVVLVAADSEPNQFIAGAATLLFAAVFIGWIVFTLAREAIRIRREEEPADDPHLLHVPELGATMADGGEPTARKERPR